MTRGSFYVGDRVEVAYHEHSIKTWFKGHVRHFNENQPRFPYQVRLDDGRLVNFAEHEMTRIAE